MNTAVGKLFLIGDDLDWTGKRSLLYGIPLTTSVQIDRGPFDLIHIIGEQGPETMTLRELDRFVCKNSFYDYVRAGLSLWNREVAKLTGMTLTIESTIPPKSGLGSSAAVLVSLFRALADYCHVEMEEDRICQLGRITESEYIGAVVGSADFYISYNGGTMLFDSADNSRTYYHCDLSNYRIVLIYSGSPSDTKAVNQDKMKRFQEGERSFIAYIEKTDLLVLEALRAVESNDIERLGECITQAHGYLRRDLKVSNAEIDHIVRLCNENGAAGTKLTGCGMGGYVFSIIEKERVNHLRGILDEKRMEYILV